MPATRDSTAKQEKCRRFSSRLITAHWLFHPLLLLSHTSAKHCQSFGRQSELHRMTAEIAPYWRQQRKWKRVVSVVDESPQWASGDSHALVAAYVSTVKRPFHYASYSGLTKVRLVRRRLNSRPLTSSGIVAYNTQIRDRSPRSSRCCSSTLSGTIDQRVETFDGVRRRHDALYTTMGYEAQSAKPHMLRPRAI